MQVVDPVFYEPLGEKLWKGCHHTYCRGLAVLLEKLSKLKQQPMRLRITPRDEEIIVTDIVNLAPLAPLVTALVVRYLVSRRDDAMLREVHHEKNEDLKAPQVFAYPRGIVKATFVSAIVLPLVFFLLPDAAVQDARSLFNVGAVILGGLLLFSWVYLYKYRIIVTRNEIRYGAFKTSSIDLSRVTSIKYFWIDNGINLKLFRDNRRIGFFEGGVENFDTFAKAVRKRLPEGVQVETTGKASF